MNKNYTLRRELTNVEKQRLRDLIRRTYSGYLPKIEHGTELRSMWFSIVKQFNNDGWLSDKQITALEYAFNRAEQTRKSKFLKATGDLEKAIKLKRAIEQSLDHM